MRVPWAIMAGSLVVMSVCNRYAQASERFELELRIAVDSSRDKEIAARAGAKEGDAIRVGDVRVAKWVPIASAQVQDILATPGLVLRKDGKLVKVLVLLGKDDVIDSVEALGGDRDGMNRTVLRVYFDSKGQASLRRMTENNQGKRLGIVVNGEVWSVQEIVSVFEQSVIVPGILQTRTIQDLIAEGQYEERFVVQSKTPPRDVGFVLPLIGVLGIVIMLLSIIPTGSFCPGKCPLLWKVGLLLVGAGLGGYHFGFSRVDGVTTVPMGGGAAFQINYSLSMLGFLLGVVFGGLAGWSLAPCVRTVILRALHNVRSAFAGSKGV